MLISDSVEIGRMNFEELHDALSELGAELMSKALKLIESGDAVFTKQNDEESTYAGMIMKQDGRIDFDDSAEAIDRKIRAFDPWPGAFCELDGKTVKIWKAEPGTFVPGTKGEIGEAAPGTIVEADPSGIKVKCGSGVLVIKELQLPGKKRTSVKDFLLGHNIEKGTILQ